MWVEEAHCKKSCDKITAFEPDLVITKKGRSDLAQHFSNKADATAVSRLRKSYNQRVARTHGATVVDRTDEITEEDVGTGAGLVGVRKVGDKYFTLIEQGKDPKACTTLLRGASKDILNEVEGNLQDNLNVARILYQEPSLVPGGGAMEIEVAHRLREEDKTMTAFARTQDGEVGDSTTSGVVLAAEMLGTSPQFLEEKTHPTVVIRGYRPAL